jgi:hypothetical protein
MAVWTVQRHTHYGDLSQLCNPGQTPAVLISRSHMLKTPKKADIPE